MKRELDTRITGEGERISLLWDDELDQVELLVEGKDGALKHQATVPSASASDAFRHPYLYLREPATV
jgi:hypothetical protein